MSTYVAKGLWRGEILHALDHLHLHVRPMLIQMLSWYAGIRTGFTASVGKNAKYPEKYIPDSTWRKLLETNPKGNYEEVWRALEATAERFRETAEEVARHFGFGYDRRQDEKVSAYLQKVKRLPTGATDFSDG